MTTINYGEEKLQQRCVSWFRAQYRDFGGVLYHVTNEANKLGVKYMGRMKAGGVLAGVSDLNLDVPSVLDGVVWHGMRIELKSEKGRQQESQKLFEKRMERCGYFYCVVRRFEDFESLVNSYMGGVDAEIKAMMHELWQEQEQSKLEEARAQLRKLIG